MKQMILRTLLLIAGLLVCLTINAEKWWESQFKIDVDGIVYDIGCYHNTDDGTSVEYEAILYDGKSCFGDIVIPEEVTHFDSYKVTTIGASAFENCTDLRSVIIPESVENIESGAFANCTGLTSVNIPKSVKIIEPSTFGGCSSLTSIIIPDSVVEIQGDYRGGAFEHCTSLKNVIIGNSVTTIGCLAFYNCSSLTSITIPNSVKEIKGDYAHCVYGGAFEHCTSLKYVIFGNSLTKIGNYVFRGCTDLRTITIPNSMNEIAYGAFTGCTGLVSVNLGDSIKTIIHEAFKGCTSLQSIIIPNSIKDILRGVFEDCTGLKSVTFGDSVKTIGSFAFNGCTSLTDVNLGSSLQEIENSAFDGCISLKSIVIPNSVTTIGQNAFNNCSSLTSLTLGEAVVEIESGAFFNCASLEEIYSLNPTPPGIVPKGNSHSPFNSYDATLYVPKGSLQLYKSAPVWELFLKIKEIGAASECTVTVPANVEHGTLVVMNGTEALVAGENEVESNTKLTITATPDEGYVLESLTVNGADFTNGNTYTVTENTNIAVSFVKAPVKNYMMRWVIEGDGEGILTVTDSEQNSYAAGTPIVEGTELTVTFTPAEHSLLQEAKINDKSILNELQNNSYTFTVSEDFTITANYAATYEVTAQVKEGEGDIQIKVGDKTHASGSRFTTSTGVTAVFAPAAGFKLKKATLYTLGFPMDITSKLIDGTFTFEITADVQLEAEFETVIDGIGAVALDEITVNCKEGKLYIGGVTDNAYELEVYSTAGQLMLTSRKAVVNVENLAACSYLAKVKVANGSKVVKFIKK